MASDSVLLHMPNAVSEKKRTEKNSIRHKKSILFSFHSSLFAPISSFRPHLTSPFPSPPLDKAEDRDAGHLARGHWSCLDMATFVLTAGNKRLHYTVLSHQ